MQWILASASPRRKQLLREVIDDFEIIPAKGEENANSATTPEELVKMLAAQKAREVFAMPQSKGKAVLGADTVVALDNEVLGKPKDEADAKRMLSALSGRSHDVYTGVCVIFPDGEECIDCARTGVEFERLTKEQINKYVQSGSPMDKAGAYGIQDGGLVRCIHGSFSNVVGLPVELCRQMMKKA